jgi:hypothetical protein
MSKLSLENNDDSIFKRIKEAADHVVAPSKPTPGGIKTTSMLKG